MRGSEKEAASEQGHQRTVITGKLASEEAILSLMAEILMGKKKKTFGNKTC